MWPSPPSRPPCRPRALPIAARTSCALARRCTASGGSRDVPVPSIGPVDGEPSRTRRVRRSARRHRGGLGPSSRMLRLCPGAPRRARGRGGTMPCGGRRRIPRPGDAGRVPCPGRRGRRTAGGQMVTRRRERKATMMMSADIRRKGFPRGTGGTAPRLDRSCSACAERSPPRRRRLWTDPRRLAPSRSLLVGRRRRFDRRSKSTSGESRRAPSPPSRGRGPARAYSPRRPSRGPCGGASR
mmetsp:Transcript_55061/g.164928  ORF Transcript_55061/g.164928 Transcript_55061/m.164928 type:complete len:240 (-) Transcript_55061:981-1700(-)